MKLNRGNLSDLRGVARLIVEATHGVAGIVESMHRTIQRLPGPFGQPVAERTRGITGLVYRSVQGGTRLVGWGIDAGIAQVMARLHQDEPDPGRARDGVVSALNGIYGDYLCRTRNPLAIEMGLYHRGCRLRPERSASAFDREGLAPPSGKLLLLVHGLCRNDRQWARGEHDHGAALADEFGYTSLYLRYNSGRRVATNGQALAQMLETLIERWPLPVEELTIIGHSMGGLLARSAVHHAELAGLVWPGRLDKLVFLGTPHHGAPLVLSGHWSDLALGLSPYSAPLARIGKTRSAGIVDLHHGSITSGTHEHVALPGGVDCYALATTLAERRGALRERLIGDGLVPLASALGEHDDPARMLEIPPRRQWIGYRMGHFDLLNHPEVYARLRNWLDPEIRDRAPTRRLSGRVLQART